MKDYLKCLPLCLAMSSSVVLAADIPEQIKSKPVDVESLLTLKKMDTEIDKIIYQPTFVNVEIQEVVLKNTKKTFDEIDTSVKSIKNQFELDKFFQSAGDVQETNIFNFTKIHTDKKVNVNNSYVRKQVVNANNGSKNSQLQNIIENSNQYNFNINMSRFGDKSIRVTIDGLINTEYSHADLVANAVTNKEHGGMSNSFNQSALINIDQYTILSSDVKDSGLDSKTREQKLFIVKVTEIQD